MAEPLEKLATRLESDPFFLACPLGLFARSEKLDDRQLAERLGCAVETLVQVRLCRAPAGEAAQFQKDIACIAATFAVDASVLTEAVRRGQTLFSMRKASPTNTLMAARDAEDEPQDSEGGDS
jgi:hypothetical protein